ncbi:MAG: transposase [Bdellovibrionota bacterium]
MVKKRAKNTHYSLEFKKRAVMLAQKEGVTLSEIACELGIPRANLSRWKTEFSKQDGLENTEQKIDALTENKQLKRQLKELQMENEILKKAASYFASHQ